MTRHPHTASTITDDALAQLYDNANKGWRRGDRWKEQATAAAAARDEVLRIVAAWYVDVNDGLGRDASDLVGDLERAATSSRRTRDERLRGLRRVGERLPVPPAPGAARRAPGRPARPVRRGRRVPGAPPLQLGRDRRHPRRSRAVLPDRRGRPRHGEHHPGRRGDAAVAGGRAARAVASALAAPAAGRPHRDCRWLAMELDWIVDHYPGTGDLAREVRELEGQARTIVGDPAPRPQRLGTCVAVTDDEGTVCGAVISRLPGQTRLVCRWCGTEYGPQLYLTLANFQPKKTAYH
ncbi:hypothetical protein GCM10020295_44480 [Streptomyces cinereospinus]